MNSIEDSWALKADGLEESLSTTLSKFEIGLLSNYLGPREQGITFYNFIAKYEEAIPLIYRGSMYLKEDLQIGNKYEPWSLVSSWSTKDNIAIGFSEDLYVPEDLVSDVASVRNISEKDAYQLFVPVVFVWKNAKGFDVNKHLSNHPFEKELEVIVTAPQFEIIDIKQKITDNGFNYFTVEVINSN